MAQSCTKITARMTQEEAEQILLHASKIDYVENERLTRVQTLACNINRLRSYTAYLSRQGIGNYFIVSYNLMSELAEVGINFKEPLADCSILVMEWGSNYEILCSFVSPIGRGVHGYEIIFNPDFGKYACRMTIPPPQ